MNQSLVADRGSNWSKVAQKIVFLSQFPSDFIPSITAAFLSPLLVFSVSCKLKAKDFFAILWQIGALAGCGMNSEISILYSEWIIVLPVLTIFARWRTCSIVYFMQSKCFNVMNYQAPIPSTWRQLKPDFHELTCAFSWLDSARSVLLYEKIQVKI